MEREQAYEAESAAGECDQRESTPDDSLAPLSYAYRHGDGSAEILGAELTDATQAQVEMARVVSR